MSESWRMLARIHRTGEVTVYSPRSKRTQQHKQHVFGANASQFERIIGARNSFVNRRDVEVKTRENRSTQKEEHDWLEERLRSHRLVMEKCDNSLKKHKGATLHESSGRGERETVKDRSSCSTIQSQTIASTNNAGNTMCWNPDNSFNEDSMMLELCMSLGSISQSLNALSGREINGEESMEAHTVSTSLSPAGHCETCQCSKTSVGECIQKEKGAGNGVNDFGIKGKLIPEKKTSSKGLSNSTSRVRFQNSNSSEQRTREKIGKNEKVVPLAGKRIGTQYDQIRARGGKVAAALANAKANFLHAENPPNPPLEGRQRIENDQQLISAYEHLIEELETEQASLMHQMCDLNEHLYALGLRPNQKWQAKVRAVLDDIKNNRRLNKVGQAKEDYFQAYIRTLGQGKQRTRDLYIAALSEEELLLQLQNDTLRVIIRAFRRKVKQLATNLAAIYLDNS